MIYFDVTKTGGAGHRSGLTRVSRRLRDELGTSACEVAWNSRRAGLKPPAAAALRRQDWFFTSELFSDEERPGFAEFVSHPPCRLAAVFHDAIPLKFPHFTWPQSVARHPGYMKLLAQFDRIWAVSAASRSELVEFWRWQGLDSTPPVAVLSLGADFNGRPRGTSTAAPHAGEGRAAPSLPKVLCVGIVEPRKNQLFLLEVCAELWTEGLAFELHLVGRINPHFGAPTMARFKALRRRYRNLLFHHEAPGDEALAHWLAQAHVTALPSLAEGCGLPLLESLWSGVPVVCSDVPALQENAGAGGCLAVPTTDREGWKSALRRVIADDGLHARLSREAARRPLVRWSESAATLLEALR
jgi:glycosyltransferase involved in cell wall biosynthesis